MKSQKNLYPYFLLDNIKLLLDSSCKQNSIKDKIYFINIFYEKSILISGIIIPEFVLLKFVIINKFQKAQTIEY